MPDIYMIATSILSHHPLGGVFGQVAFLKSPNSAEQLIRVNSGFGHFFQKKSDLKKLLKSKQFDVSYHYATCNVDSIHAIKIHF